MSLQANLAPSEVCAVGGEATRFPGQLLYSQGIVTLYTGVRTATVDGTLYLERLVRTI